MTIAYSGPGNARTNYGPRLLAQKEASVQPIGASRWLKVPYTYANLPGSASATTGADACNQFIPAGSIIRACYLFTTVNFSGGTEYTYGLEQSDGTDIDVDGLVTAAQAPVANLVTTNVIAGRGAMIVEGPDAAGTAHIDSDGVYVKGATGPVTSVNAYPVIVANGTFTAGEGYMLIEYVHVG